MKVQRSAEACSTVFWFRYDLRLEDNPGLAAACRRGGVVPVFIWAPEEEGHWAPGAASRWWLRRSIERLDANLRRLGSRLVARRGPSLDSLVSVARQAGATAVFWNRRVEPALKTRDLELEKGLSLRGIATRSFEANLLYDPSSLLNREGNPFKVFTAFWNASLKLADPNPPLRAPSSMQPVDAAIGGDVFDSLGIDAPNSALSNWESLWKPGAKEANRRLGRLIEHNLLDYERRRDIPAVEGTSILSPHLHFGEIGARQVWHALRKQLVLERPSGKKRFAHACDVFLRQLVWREFALHQLHHFPRIPDEPSRMEFSKFPWRKNEKAFAVWKEGRTGYPLVDAGMRQLNETGWMHNRVRMVVASFLVKHLLISWRDGAQWFWRKLVDADLANNTMGWQWSAGCGFDAAPYFRIFNPLLQGKKFDPDGKYIRRWVPELGKLDGKLIHEPWKADPVEIRRKSAKRRPEYPRQIVEHAAARSRALAVLASVKR